MSIESSSVERRLRIHAALADGHRLSIVDELTLSDRSATELRRRLGIESNLIAHHLAVLERAGLIERVASAGDRRRKYLRLVPAALAVAWEPALRLKADGVLFVCTANSARSQLAAALWNASHEVLASSAGTVPAASVHPEALRAGSRAGLNLAGAVPRSLDELRALPELIVTVCDRAHEELARRPPSGVLLHWSIPDPAQAGRPAAFDLTIRRLSTRIGALVPYVSRPPGRRARPRRSRP
jgi:protein-tyrosine-phosphatase/DNA-binding HxlR family transcriptional regulator